MIQTNDWSKLLCSEKAIEIVAKAPHILGHIIGKTKLLPIHSEWIRYIWDTNERRALMAYRGSFKTTAICAVGIIRWLLFNPNDRIGIIRKHVFKASEVVGTVAQSMETTEVKEIFKYRFGEYPRAKISRYGVLQYTFKKTNTPEPSVLALGLDSDLTGNHFDKLIVDDFVTPKDRFSKAERRHTKNVLMEIQTNILDPGKGIGYIGTPWHREDAWNYVGSICPIAKYPISKHSYIIGNEEAAKKKAMTTPSLYAANYELDLISDESLLFSDPIFSKGWNFSIRSNVMAHVDAAYDGDCYCALTIAAQLNGYGDDRNYQAIGFCYEGHISDWYDEIVRICKKYNVMYLYEETNPDKGMSARDLTAKGLRVQAYSETQNKHLKISTCLYKVWKHIEWAPETDDEYMAQILDYREGAKPNDAPDSAASLFREAFHVNKSGASVSFAKIVY
jgi:hypothetical protein